MTPFERGREVWLLGRESGKSVGGHSEYVGDSGAVDPSGECCFVEAQSGAHFAGSGNIVEDVAIPLACWARAGRVDAEPHRVAAAWNSRVRLDHARRSIRSFMPYRAIDGR